MARASWVCQPEYGIAYADCHSVASADSCKNARQGNHDQHVDHCDRSPWETHTDAGRIADHRASSCSCTQNFAAHLPNSIHLKRVRTVARCRSSRIRSTGSRRGRSSAHLDIVCRVALSAIRADVTWLV